MKEDFLHYLWKFQKFNSNHFKSVQNENIRVTKPGFQNFDAGPDFNEARILINDIEWAGNVEIHIKSSDWDNHQHQHDKAYNNTILHVVWEYDKIIRNEEKQEIPTLELKKYVENGILENYDSLLNNLYKIPCQQSINEVPSIIKSNEVERKLIERLERKSQEIHSIYDSTQQNWTETTYQVIAKNFGFKVNSSAFLRLSEKLPLKIIQKHAQNLLQVESLLFGVAGFLEQKSDDSYYKQLQKEFSFLRHKYRLEETGTVESHEWKFLRLRPSNFPTLRIAQFASFIAKYPNPFSSFILAPDVNILLSMFKIETSPFWKEHFTFKSDATKTGNFGKNSQNNLLINTVAPLLAAYARHKNDYSYREKAVHLLEQLPSEKNKITDCMETFDFENDNAATSQGLIELHNEACLYKKCLNCGIGTHILQRN